MLAIAGYDPHPPDIGSQIPKPLLEKAGGRKNFRTFYLGSGLRVHRRIDDLRVREVVNGRRGFETQKFESKKCGRRDVHVEGKGELPLFQLAEVYPPILAYRDQHDIVEIHDEHGRCWAIPDVYVVVRPDGRPTWLEGKGFRILKRDENGFPRVEAGLRPKVRKKLLRIQRAFGRVGLTYLVVNQDWCASPAVSEVVSLAFWHRDKKPNEGERAALLKLLGEGASTIGECAAIFADRACPTEWVCGAMADGLVEIELNVHKPFSLASTVSLPSAPFWMKRAKA